MLNVKLTSEERAARKKAWREGYRERQTELDRARHLRDPKRMVRYYANNREAVLERARLKRANPETGDRMRALQMARYYRDPEAARRQASEWRKANPLAGAAWKRRNAQRVREYTMRRNALKRQTMVEKLDYAQILKDAGDKCGICALGIYVYDLIHYDHIVPLSKGGTHTKDNIQVAHAQCNLKKHAKVIAA